LRSSYNLQDFSERFAHAVDTYARQTVGMWKIQQRPYAKRAGLPGDVALGLDAGVHGCQ
jgi:hypothetical protein